MNFGLFRATAKQQPTPGKKQGAQFRSIVSPTIIEGNILDTYYVPSEAPEDARAQVLIVEKDNFGSYFVRYPDLFPEQRDALATLMDNFEYAVPAGKFPDMPSMLQAYFWETAEKAAILKTVREASAKLQYYLTRNTMGFGDLDTLMNDDDLEEISCTAWNRCLRVYHRRYTEFRFMETNITFDSEDNLARFAQRLAQMSGDNMNRAKPYVEASLPGPVERRLTATLYDEISRPGTSFDVRKQKGNTITVTQLVTPETVRPYPVVSPRPIASTLKYEERPFHKTLTALMVAYFWLLMEWKTNILIAGVPSSGKTTLLNALLALINPREKIVTVEETPEISLPETLHWQRLVVRPAKPGASSLGEMYEIGFPELLKLALRFTPTFLTAGEIRGEDSETVASAIGVGLSTLCTTHADSARDCITRITNPPMSFKMEHVRDLTAIISMRKTTLPDGKEVRRVFSVDEIVPHEIDDSRYQIRNIFRYLPAGDGFVPTTPEEVIERSFRLIKIAERFGWSNEHILQSLTSRAAYLTEAVKQGVFSVEALSRTVRDYYAREFPKELRRETERAEKQE